MKPILEIEDLSVSFTQYTKGAKQKTNKVINNLSVSINEGEILAVVGASGSGKSLLAHSILDILPVNSRLSGSIKYRGKDLTTEKVLELRGQEIALIPQSVNFLDPLMKVGEQVRTAVRGEDPVTAQKKIFEEYKLNNGVEDLYPFQLSGGMARRVLVSMAIVSGAELVIADEPTPGLDKDVIQDTLSSFKALAEKGKGVMLITHDIESALEIADKIAVFYAGTTVEVAPIEDFKGNGEALRHPYTKALWRALPQNDFTPIPGSQPQPGSDAMPHGCLFEPRCMEATLECGLELPDVKNIRGGLVRCVHAT